VTNAGAVTYFAPYYVMKLWDDFMEPGAPGLAVTNSTLSNIDIFAVRTPTGINVAIVNRAAVPVTLHLNCAVQAALSQVYVVDQRGYSEQYNASSQSTYLARDGVTLLNSPANNEFQILGYGFALAQFVDLGAPQ
jgi:hypothetical protein